MKATLIECFFNKTWPSRIIIKQDRHDTAVHEVLANMKQWEETFNVVLHWILTASAIVGNGLVIYLVIFRRRLNSTANWFVLSLAVADFFVGATYFPYQRACKSEPCYKRHIQWLCVDVFLCASVTNLCLMTVDRYIAIVKPLKYLTVMTTRKTLFAISAAWCIPIVTALLPLSWTYSATSPASKAISWKVFTFATLIVYGIAPFVFLPSAIVQILLIVRRCRLERSAVMAQLDFNYSGLRRNRQLDPEKEISSTRLIVSVVVMFLVCYVFGVSVRIASVFGHQQPPESVLVTSSILILTNSAANPVAYGLMKRDFKRELLKTFKINNSSSDLAFEEVL